MSKRQPSRRARKIEHRVTVLIVLLIIAVFEYRTHRSTVIMAGCVAAGILASRLYSVLRTAVRTFRTVYRQELAGRRRARSSGPARQQSRTPVKRTGNATSARLRIPTIRWSVECLDNEHGKCDGIQCDCPECNHPAQRAAAKREKARKRESWAVSDDEVPPF